MRYKLTFATILALLAAVFVPYAAAAADISSGSSVVAARAAAEQTLRSLNINPSDAVFQVGSRNYAGPDCPGSDWNCTTATTVVQIGTADARGNTPTNSFRCTTSTGGSQSNTPAAQTCVVVQGTPTSTGLNSAQCVQHTSANPANQSCMISQTNMSGTNRVFIDQRISQSQTQGTQSARQFVEVEQQNGTGPNESGIAQTINQSQSKKLNRSGTLVQNTVDQKQEAHQRADVCQGGSFCGANSEGRNLSGVAQINNQKASVRYDHGTTGAVTQNQNTDPCVACDGESATSLAIVSQNSTNRTNDSGLLHYSRQVATVSKGSDDHDDDDRLSASTSGFTGPVVQQQGIADNRCPNSGLCGYIYQDSIGVQRALERQDELQKVDGPTQAVQSQYGPEFCCATQTGGNSSNIDIIKQVKVQLHSGTITEGYIQGHCDSASPDGDNCRIDQFLRQNEDTETNDCNGSECNPFIQCTDPGIEEDECIGENPEGFTQPPCPSPAPNCSDFSPPITRFVPIWRDEGSVTT